MMKKRGPLKLEMPADSLQQIKDLSRNALLGPRKCTQCCASFNALHRVLLAAALVEGRNFVHPSPGSCLLCFESLKFHYHQQGSPGRREYPLPKPKLSRPRRKVPSASLKPSPVFNNIVLSYRRLHGQFILVPSQQ